MSDDQELPFYSPNYRPPPATTAVLRSRSGTFRKDYATWSCGLRYHSEWSVEAQIFRDTDFVIGRRFDLRELALRWAEELRGDIERGLLENDD